MPRPGRTPRKAYVTVTLVDVEKASIERAAKASGNTISTWCRWAMLKCLPQRERNHLATNAGLPSRKVLQSETQPGDEEMTWHRSHEPTEVQVMSAEVKVLGEILEEFEKLNHTMKEILGVLREKPKPRIVGHFGEPRPGTTP